MTTWALDVSASWDGPAWAAPECAERISTHPEPSPEGLARRLHGVLCAALVAGLIDAEQFQLALPLGRR